MPPARPRPRFSLRLTPAVTWIVVASVAAFVVYAFAGNAAKAALERWLVLTPASLLEGHVWKLVTTAVFTASPLAFILDVVVLALFMPFLEGEWGTRRFLRFAAITTVAGNLAAAIVGLLLGGVAAQIQIAGLSPFVYAALVGFGVAFGSRPIQFFGVIPMKGRTLAIGIAVVVVLSAVLNGAWVEGAGNVVAMVTAYVLTSGRVTPQLWLLRWRRARIRRRYSVIEGGAGKKTKDWLN